MGAIESKAEIMSVLWSRLDEDGQHNLREVEGELRTVGLDSDGEWELLFETCWRITGTEPTRRWPGLATAIEEICRPGSEYVRLGKERPGLAAFVRGLVGHAPAFCDLRAPQRDDAFELLPLSRFERQQVALCAGRILSRQDVVVFLPLLVGAHLRCRANGGYAEVLGASDEVLAVPRLLRELDRRRVRWLAVQLYGFWLNPREAARYLLERLVLPFRTAEVQRWESLMRSANDGGPTRT